MAGSAVDFQWASMPVPGDGRPKVQNYGVDRDNNAVYNDVYFYGTNANGTRTRQQVGPSLQRTTYSATTTVTQKEGVIIQTGSARALTIPTPVTVTDDGKLLTIVNGNAGSNTVTAGASKIYDQGTTTASPAAQTTVTLHGIGAFIQLVAVGGLWFTASGTLDADNADAIYVTYA